jgi:hypothetical protein
MMRIIGENLIRLTEAKYDQEIVVNKKSNYLKKIVRILTELNVVKIIDY